MYPSNSTRTPRVRVLTISAKLLEPICTGEVSERFKEHAWKACVGEILPWVQIPPSPPTSNSTEAKTYTPGRNQETEVYVRTYESALRRNSHSICKRRRSV